MPQALAVKEQLLLLFLQPIATPHACAASWSGRDMVRTEPPLLRGPAGTNETRLVVVKSAVDRILETPTRDSWDTLEDRKAAIQDFMSYALPS